MTIIGNAKRPAVAMKALILNGVADLLLMFGIAITAMQAGTMAMDMIVDIPMEGLGIVGFVCMMLGAIGKAGKFDAIPQLDTRCCGTSPIAFHGDSSCGIRKNAWHLSIGSGLLDFL